MSKKIHDPSDEAYWFPLAQSKVAGMPDEIQEFALSDWTDPGHYCWLATHSQEEIKSWYEACQD